MNLSCSEASRSELSSSSPPPLQGKAPKEIHAILTETLAYFLPSRAKDLTAPLYSEHLTKEALEGFGDFGIGKEIRTVEYPDVLMLLAKGEKGATGHD